MTDPRDHAQRHDAGGGDTPDVGRREDEGEPRNDADGDVVAVGDESAPMPTSSTPTTRSRRRRSRPSTPTTHPA